mgnify:CR=1 FL=1
MVIKTVDRLLGRKEGEDMDLITYVNDRKGHDMRYAIDSRKLQAELGWEPSPQFEEGVEETVKWYLENQEWMDNVTSGDYQKYYENMESKPHLSLPSGRVLNPLPSPRPFQKGKGCNRPTRCS